MEEAKTMKIPMSSSIKLDKDEKGKSIDSTMYRGMIGDRQLPLGHRASALLSCLNLAQMEAFRNARFDTTLFSTVEDYQRYK
ncbi:hypothetical protein CK203_116207 [Vitis vinifera]|uniref:Uncharacterized protein n=1 Tax=Vitis vinifera TaxID=29760 RepID=A0A438CB53_VITVI|nr:hypothetical protein CK203_116207 [Vitis vinifera]